MSTGVRCVRRAELKVIFMCHNRCGREVSRRNARRCHDYTATRRASNMGCTTTSSIVIRREHTGWSRAYSRSSLCGMAAIRRRARWSRRCVPIHDGGYRHKREAHPHPIHSSFRTKYCKQRPWYRTAVTIVRNTSPTLDDGVPHMLPYLWRWRTRLCPSGTAPVLTGPPWHRRPFCQRARASLDPLQRCEASSGRA